MVLKGGTLVDPALEDGDFGRREAADFCVGRRHHFLRVGTGDAEDDFALRALAGDDYGRAILFTEGSLAGIEAEFAFAAALIGAVAMKALVREDRPHLAAVVDRRSGGGSAGDGRTPCEHDESKQVAEKGAEAGHRGEFRESEERGKWTRRVRGWQSLTRCGRDARRGLAALSCGAVLAIECALGRSFVACLRYGGRT